MIRILDTPVSRIGFQGLLDSIDQGVREAKGTSVFFGNAHNLVEAKRDAVIGNAFRTAGFVVADGLPLVWASRLYGEPIASRVCGPDVMAEVLRSHPDWVHGLIGGRVEQLKKITEKFQIHSVIYSPPYRPLTETSAKEDWENFLKLCPDRKPPPIVWVGLGAPKQEMWIHQVARLAPGTWFLGVGAAFDFLSGTKERAPVWMQKSGLEWFFRLVSEPGRLWKRYLVTNSIFAYEVLRGFFQRGR